MSEDRVLPLEGVHNFRDYGGYAVAGGGRLKRGLLWRSGQHHGATDADLAQIAALGLADVFDLRSPEERETHPCRRPDGFAARVHLTEKRTEMLAPHVEAARVPGQPRDAASVREGMRRNYGRIAYRPELVAAIGQHFRALAENRGPSLVNCMAGKDRTGIAVAMIQTALGVHRDDIMADYLLTNTVGDPEARIAAGAETIKAIARQMDMEVVRVLMGVEAEYLEAAFAMIEAENGSIEGYLRDVIGIDERLRDTVRGVLVEG
jgi:protein-tyrosine phosphatase